METILRITGLQHEKLRQHLLPEDGREAVAVALCGRHIGRDRHILTVREIFPIPYNTCTVRTAYRVTWPTETIADYLDKASRTDNAIIKIHSHPGGFAEFSETDDVSDPDLFASVYGWFESDLPHGSCIMLPDGKMFGRTVSSMGEFEALSMVSVAGDDLYFWNSSSETDTVPEFAQRHAQAFGKGTLDVLRRLSVAVVGCSGTGSPVIEQLARLGVGKLVIVDPDNVEDKNLNRILNTFESDARQRKLKVQVLADAVRKMGTGTQVVPLSLNLYSVEAVNAVAECDLIFGCMDSIDGRHLLNRLAVFYNIPYIDIGVRLIADGLGGVQQICGSVHYLQPDRSSLMSRGLYTLEKLYAASIRRTNPEEYQKQVKEKYISGVLEDRPAVISVNMEFGAMAVNELLARIHHFRDDANKYYAITTKSLTQAQTYYEEDGEPCRVLSRHTGRGDVLPLLDMPELSETERFLKRRAAS